MILPATHYVLEVSNMMLGSSTSTPFQPLGAIITDIYSVSISGYYPASCSSWPGHDVRLGSTPILLQLWFEWGYYPASLPHGLDTLIPGTHREAGSFMVGRYFTPDPSISLLLVIMVLAV